MALGVTVGVGVTLGVLEAVGVGPVAVGNGPIRALEVRAMDVRVLLALAKSCRPETAGWMREMTYDSVDRNRNNRHPSNTCRKIGCSRQRKFIYIYLFS